MARIRAGGQPSSRLPGNPRLSAGPGSQFRPPGASLPVSRKPTQPPEEATRSDPESPALRAPLRRHLLDAPGPRAAVTLCHRLGGLKHTALLSRAGGPVSPGHGRGVGGSGSCWSFHGGIPAPCFPQRPVAPGLLARVPSFTFRSHGLAPRSHTSLRLPLRRSAFTTLRATPIG